MVKKYAGGFSRWKRWAKSKPGVEAFPPKPFQLALYLAFLPELGYTQVRELVVEKLQKIGLDPKMFGLHSLRAGDMSAAVNAGIPDHWFK